MDLTEPTKKEIEQSLQRKRQNRAYKERQNRAYKERDRTEPTKKLYRTKSDLALLKYKKPNSIYK